MRRSRWRRLCAVWTALGVATGTTTSGCSGVATTGECRELAGLVNPVLGELNTALGSAGATASHYLAIASTYEALAERVRRRAFTRAELAEASASYADVLRRSAAASREFARAVGARDPRWLSRLQAQSAELLARETAVLARLRQVCRVP